MKSCSPIRTGIHALVSVAVICVCACTASAGYFSSGNVIGSPLPGEANLYGDATWHDRAFWLTHNGQFQEGSVILDDLDPGLPVASFWMDVMLYIGNGDTMGGDGLSFCFGDLPAAGFGEKGAGSGLCVMLDTFENWDDPDDHYSRIRVTYGGVFVAESDWIDLRPMISEYVWNDEYGYEELIHEPQWFPLAVGVDETGEVLVLGPGLYAEVLGQIDDWNPQPGWQFGLGARSGWYTDIHGVWDLTIETVPVPEPASMVLLAAGGLALIRRRRTA